MHWHSLRFYYHSITYRASLGGGTSCAMLIGSLNAFPTFNSFGTGNLDSYITSLFTPPYEPIYNASYCDCSNMDMFSEVERNTCSKIQYSFSSMKLIYIEHICTDVSLDTAFNEYDFCCIISCHYDYYYYRCLSFTTINNILPV